jgi:hypothetical protein
LLLELSDAYQKLVLLFQDFFDVLTGKRFVAFGKVLDLLYRLHEHLLFVFFGIFICKHAIVDEAELILLWSVCKRSLELLRVLLNHLLFSQCLTLLSSRYASSVLTKPGKNKESVLEKVITKHLSE